LDLHKDIYLKTSTGYEAWLTHALVDLARNTVTSDEPVDVKMPDGGTLRSDRMRILEGGAVAYFEGNVVMNLIPDNPPVDTSAPAEPAPPANPPSQSGKARPSSANRASAK